MAGWQESLARPTGRQADGIRLALLIGVERWVMGWTVPASQGGQGIVRVTGEGVGLSREKRGAGARPAREVR